MDSSRQIKYPGPLFRNIKDPAERLGSFPIFGHGHGISSRWYPGTLVKRLEAIDHYADRIAFCETDGMQFPEALACDLNEDVVVFVDPPYTAGGNARARDSMRIVKSTMNGYFPYWLKAGRIF